METLEFEVDQRGVATLTLARPEKHNALSGTMIAELRALADSLQTKTDLRAVVLRGGGKSFCAGGDLNWMRAQFEADRATKAREARALAEMLFAMNALPQPLIGAVQGNAFGGGLGLMCVCDTVVSIESAKFGLTETKLGLIPATIGPYVLARMGGGPARRVFMSSRLFGAQDALNLGLVHRVETVSSFEAGVAAEVVPYLSCAPGAVAEAKALTRSLGYAPTQEDIDVSIEALIARWESAEAQEGVAAFFEQRATPWAAKKG
ncbi:MAG: crotonase/enoyl-CoA hydratase family protein [Pseudomonadota bacterium]